MGSVKRYMEQMEADEKMDDWIRENVDLGVEEGGPEWDAVKEMYLSGAASESYWDADYADEYDRLTAQDVALCSMQMNILKDKSSEDLSLSLIKMN